jgi:prepilin-type N-terminal cleavage/methylation domain-containing protein
LTPKPVRNPFPSPVTKGNNPLSLFRSQLQKEPDFGLIPDGTIIAPVGPAEFVRPAEHSMSGGKHVNMKDSRSTAKQRGFTLTQMVIVIAIISVVTTFGVLGIRTARAEFQHQSNARLFASYVEKARADAIRRHASGGQVSSIETFGPETTAYAVTMDWGSGTVETRTFNLDNGLTFDVAAQKVSFDWRGRISAAWVWQIKSAYLDKRVPVDVSGSGDITVGSQHFPDQMIPDNPITQVTGDVASPEPSPSPTDSPVIPIDEQPPADPTPIPIGDPPADSSPTPTPSPTATPNGNGNGHGNSSPTPTPTPTPTATPTPAVGPCVASLSPSTLSLSQGQSGSQTGTTTFTMMNATGVRTITAAQAGNGNAMTIDVGLQRIDGNGSSVITITTKQGGGNRGVFVVNVSADPSCGSVQQLTVSISN